MLNEQDTGLIVTDIQGRLAKTVYQSEAFLLKCEQLIRAAEVLALPIIWLEQVPDKLGATTPVLQPFINRNSLITKCTFDACQNAQFVDTIQRNGKNQWLICGIEAHICVYQTALSLLERGYTVFPVSDAVSSRDPDNKQLALANLRDAGAAISSVEMCLYQLLGSSQHPAFADILAMIKE
ncbi:isochorismatase family protein [Salinimonas sp. HHU 13199]|uniref:Isochorismatase family protein n=1 Tax=Salinimonas profundi TaxID=2729140 RepID=A0ABR8LEH2_9ALTE|nr:isochorismatase family protein [Salinimonas profundi]MBD3584687.1 isochorismatase family protein [Salinimonas profundi]